MKKVFLHLTMTFWTLFMVVICAFGINFYLSYEKNYSQKLLEIERSLNNVGESVNDILNNYINLALSLDSIIETFYETSYELYQQIPDEKLDGLLQESHIELINGNLQNDKRKTLTYFQMLKQIEMINSDLINTNSSKYKLTLFQFVPCSSFSEMRTEIDKVKENDILITDNDVTIVEIQKEDNKRFGRVYKAIEYDENMIGYILLEYEPRYLTNPLISLLENSIYSVDNQIHRINTSANLDLDSDNMDLVVRELNNKGYYISRYSSTEGLVDIAYFCSERELNQIVLKQTLNLFEFSTIIFISLFLIVSYLLFMVIVRPCYLLIEYVRKCGEGDYTIPSEINDSWRPSFVRIRNAYLENERLLAIKDNQSQELEYAWKKALVANQAKTHFLAKVSHELKTPLNAIKGYIQLLKLSIDNPKQLRQIEIINHSSDLLLRHVNELLDFSVIEEGKVKLEIEKMNLFQTAKEIEELFIINMNKKNLDYSVIINEQIPSVLYGDESRIQQIIINLVSNALKFTESGKIQVSFDLDYQTENEIYLSIRVKDTGKGIAPNKLNSIFESFTQENNSISREFGGTGLGLSISKKLAEVMRGNLIVESEVNVGSTFTLFLPLSKVPIVVEN